MDWLLGLGMKLKIYAGLALAAVIAIGIAFLRGREAGKQVMRDAQEKARSEAIVARKESDDEVDRMGSADVDREYERWLRDDER